MDPNKSPITKTSPMIIRLSTITSPTKQDSPKIETSSEAPKRVLDFSATNEKMTVPSAKSPKQSCNVIEKISPIPGSSRKKRRKHQSLELDKSNVITYSLRDPVTQPIKSNISISPSINASKSKQSPNVFLCDDSNNVTITRGMKFVRKSTDSDNELEKCAISKKRVQIPSSKNVESPNLTEVQSVSYRKTPTSHSARRGKKKTAFAKKMCQSNQTLSQEKLAVITQPTPSQTLSLCSTTKGDTKDFTDSKIIAIKIEREVMEDSEINVESNFDGSNPIVELTDCQLKQGFQSTLDPQLPGFLKVNNQPNEQIQSSPFEGIQTNEITSPEIKPNLEDVQIDPMQSLSEQIKVEASGTHIKLEPVESLEMHSSSSEGAFPQQIPSTLVSENERIFSEEALGFSEVESEQISEFSLSCEQMDPVGWAIAKTSSLEFENLGTTLERDITMAEEYLHIKPPEECDMANNVLRNSEVLQEEIFSQDSAPLPSTAEPAIAQLHDYQSLQLEESSNGINSSREVSNHPWDEQTTNSVSELEITELERIRESLRIQLSQGNGDTTDSGDSSLTESRNVEAMTGIKLELNENLSPVALTSTASSMESSAATGDKLNPDQKHCPPKISSGGSLNEPSTVEETSDLRYEFGKCPFGKPASSSRDRKSPIAEVSEAIPPAEEVPSPISDQCEFTEIEEESLDEKMELSSPAAENTGNSSNSASDKPPLVMHSSNLLLNYGLDNRHGGGGNETTGLIDSEAPPPKKRLKLDGEEDTEKDGGRSGDEPMPDCDEALVPYQESPTHNGSEDYPNSEQNGLMEFDILDEFESDGNDEQNDGNSDSDSSDAYDAEEIDALLDAKLKEYKTLDPNNELAHEEKQKVVLKVKGKDHFEVLPEGWIEVTHNCGMPIYLHKQTRVCCMSKPYFLGPGSTRKHKIPTSAIPCFHYLKETEKEKQRASTEGSADIVNGQGESTDTPVDGTSNPSDAINKDKANTNIDKENDKENTNNNKENATENTIVNGIFPSAKLQSAKDTKESGSLDFLAVRKYCEKRFEFQRITVKRFSTWSGRRKHQKKMKHEQRPFLPDDTKLITCPLYGASEKSTVSGTNVGKREFIMNPSGKSPVCILHEYVQHTLRLQPKYEFRELENARTPYGAVVVIDGIEYGNGYGSSKKLAKSDAARAALEILIPNMKLLREENREVQDVEFFDQVRVEDPRVSDLSVKAGQPYPYQILLECLKRNYGMGDTEIEFSMTNIKHQKNEFHMKVGKHYVSVVCKNKRDGKHRASQAILQKLHPHITSWGSLLRMYGKGSCKTLKEKKEEEQRITELQSKACANKPNTSILCKLKEEMMKYREKVKSKKPIGKLIPERMEFLTTSSSNLKNLEL